MACYSFQRRVHRSCLTFSSRLISAVPFAAIRFSFATAIMRSSSYPNLHPHQLCLLLTAASLLMIGLDAAWSRQHGWYVPWNAGWLLSVSICCSASPTLCDARGLVWHRDFSALECRSSLSLGFFQRQISPSLFRSLKS